VLKGTLNTLFHEAGSSVSEDNNTLYFTRNFYNKGKKGFSKDNTLKLEILQAVREGDKWRVDKPFIYNNKNYSVGHPYFSERQNKLYFVSDMPGSYGGTDVYVCEKVGDNWGQPLNLGPKINTEKNEMFPFIGPDSALYFSSEGHVGFGGLDVFKATLDKGKVWKDPVNLGLGVNSDKDDFSFILDKDKRTGYFSSNREGGKGSDDLYYFESRAPKIEFKDTVLTLVKKKEVKPKSNVIDYAVKVEDEESGMPLRNVGVTLYDETDNTSQNSITDADGKAIFRIDPSHKFTVKINKDGYLNTSKNGVDANNPEDGNLSMYKKELNRAIVIKHIYYPFNKAVITAESALRLDVLVNLMRENPDIEIELSSHTDSRASDAYNQKLSDERARSAVEYIISRGVKRSRIFAKGYGESRLVNSCKNGVKCSDWEHAQNRRTEFKIIGLNGGTVSSKAGR
jgi:outer membrane protein OmpA-like peptidoglycan-associated protein